MVMKNLESLANNSGKTLAARQWSAASVAGIRWGVLFQFVDSAVENIPHLSE